MRREIWPEGRGFFNDYSDFMGIARELAQNIATNGKAKWPKKLAVAGNLLQEKLSKCPAVECQWPYAAQVIEARVAEPDEVIETIEKVEWEVMKVTTSRQESKAGKRSLKINYHCTLNDKFRIFTDYIGFDGNAGFAKRKWRQLSLTDYPEHTEDAVTMARVGAIGIPDRVRVWTEKGWDRVEPVSGFRKPRNEDLIYE